jgi:hypothetical protein
MIEQVFPVQDGTSIAIDAAEIRVSAEACHGSGMRRLAVPRNRDSTECDIGPRFRGTAFGRK